MNTHTNLSFSDLSEIFVCQNCAAILTTRQDIYTPVIPLSIFGVLHDVDIFDECLCDL